MWCLFEVIAWILADGQDADARDTKKRRKQRPVHLRIGTVGAGGTFVAEDSKKMDGLIDTVMMQKAEATIAADQEMIFKMVRRGVRTNQLESNDGQVCGRRSGGALVDSKAAPRAAHRSPHHASA